MKKQGWKTSEFWVTVAASTVAILNEAFGWNLPKEGILTVAGLVATYVLSRTAVKMGEKKE